MARFWIDCFPWDLEDEGVEQALSRIKGDLYADDICVQVHSDDVTLRRARPIGDARVVRVSAGAHFRPDASRYSATRIRPVASSWMKSRDPFTRISKACESIGVGLTVRASCLRNRALVEKNPLAACVDAYGDASRNRLCPANPDVREYVAALAADLAESYPTRSIELADVTFDSSRYARERTLGVDLLGSARDLLDWCFCASCRQRTADQDCDAEAVQKTARELLDGAYQAGSIEQFNRQSSERLLELSNDPGLRRFQDVRYASERSLITAAHAKAGDKVVFPVNDETELLVIRPVSLELGAEMVARYKRAPQRSIIHGAAMKPHEPSRVAVRFDAYPPFIDGGPSLVAAVHEAVEAGHERVGFYADGVLSAPSLDFIRQSIRYARRESRG